MLAQQLKHAIRDIGFIRCAWMRLRVFDNVFFNDFPEITMEPTRLIACNCSLGQSGIRPSSDITADKPAQHLNLTLEADALGALGRELRLEARDLDVALLELLVEGGGPALEPGRGLLERPELVVGPLALELGDAGRLGGVAPDVPQLRARLCLRLPGGRGLVLGGGRQAEGVRVPGLSLVRGSPLGL